MEQANLQFVLDGLRLSGSRVDGRALLEQRDVSLSFGHAPGLVLASIGSSRVLVSVSGDLSTPRAERPSEGSLSFHVEASKLLSPDGGMDMVERCAELAYALERSWREAEALEVETLCLVAGKSVWHIRVEVSLLQDSGSLLDCCFLGVAAALLHFRLPDSTVIGDSLQVHAPGDKLPVPLALHRIVVSISFVTEDGLLLVDPSSAEEEALGGSIMVCVSAQKNGGARELCGARQMGCLITSSLMLEATHIALEHIALLSNLVFSMVDQDWGRRDEERLRIRSVMPAPITAQIHVQQ